MTPEHLIPDSILYTIIGGLVVALATAVSVFGGLWVRAHDNFRQWATGKLNDHEQSIVVLRSDSGSIREDIAEIKMLLHEHTKREERVHSALVAKLGLRVQEED